MALRVELFDPSRHDRSDFRCGEPALDSYLARQATQDVRRRVASLFCAVDGDDPRVLGYYTLCATTVALGELATADAKRLPPYPKVPAVLLGRLAVRSDHQGSGLGRVLLASAVRRAQVVPVAVWCVAVDAIHERAADWYSSYGFRALPHQPLRLILPLARLSPGR